MPGGWNEGPDPAWRRRRSVPPWMLVGVLLLIALAVAFHGSSGHRLRREITAWLGGGSGPVPTAPVQPGVSMQFATLREGLDQAAQGLPKGEWLNADAALGILQGTWNTLSGELAKDGVTVGAVNGFSATLSDLAAAVNAQDTARADHDVRTLQANLGDLESAYAAVTTPTGIAQLGSLTQRLNADVAAKNWSGVSREVGRLQRLVRRFQKGF